jgi:hypothetical protein
VSRRHGCYCDSSQCGAKYCSTHLLLLFTEGPPRSAFRGACFPRRGFSSTALVYGSTVEAGANPRFTAAGASSTNHQPHDSATHKLHALDPLCVSIKRLCAGPFRVFAVPKGGKHFPSRPSTQPPVLLSQGLVGDSAVASVSAAPLTVALLTVPFGSCGLRCFVQRCSNSNTHAYRMSIRIRIN